MPKSSFTAIHLRRAEGASASDDLVALAARRRAEERHVPLELLGVEAAVVRGGGLLGLPEAS